MKKLILTLTALTSFTMAGSMQCQSNIEYMVLHTNKANAFAQHDNGFNARIHLGTARDYAIEVLVDCEDNKKTVEMANKVIAMAKKWGV